MSEHVFEIAIVGSGAAGSMGSLRAVLNNLDTVCFLGSANTKRKARATWVGKVENMPVLFDYPKAVFQSANEVFKWIRSQELWKDKLTEVKDEVSSISGTAGDFTLTTEKGENFRAKYVVLCTGIMDVQPLIQGDIKNVFPMANAGHIEYCIRCDGHRTKGKRTGIIGNNETALWIASLLKERYDCPEMHVFTNGVKLDSDKSSAVWERVDCYGIRIHESPIERLVGDPKKEGLQAIALEGNTEVGCEIAFVSLGTIVYNELAKSLGCKIDGRGYVETDATGETNVGGVFAAGDLRANKKKQIYTAWDITVDSVDKIDAYIRDERRKSLLASCREENEVLGARMG